jgi:hypothetical protein
MGTRVMKQHQPLVDAFARACLRVRIMAGRGHRMHAPGSLTWGPCVGALLLLGCNAGKSTGSLVGDYDVRGVLAENSCGQTALPTVNPLDYAVELREDNGIGYWIPDKQTQNTGSLDSSGAFSFSVSQTAQYGAPATTSTTSQTATSSQPGQNAQQNLQPNDFTSLQPDFDLKQPAPCVLTSRETIIGVVHRRDAADGGAVIELPDAGSDDDLSGDDTIEITPAAGADCTAALSLSGGTYLALPCLAHYVLHGTLHGATSSASTSNPQLSAGASASGSAGRASPSTTTTPAATP